jgi:hypothetical protein
VCACLAAQFAFFSRADSGVLLTVINVQATSSTFSINHSATNVARIKLLPLPECFSSRRFRQLCQQASAALENAVCSSRHGYTGPWQTTHRRASRTLVSSRNDSCFSSLSSTYRRRQKSNGLTTLYVEVASPLCMLLVRI